MTFLFSLSGLCCGLVDREVLILAVPDLVVPRSAAKMS